MFCTNCGAQVPDTQPYCTKCGAALPAAANQPQRQGAPNPVQPAYTPAYVPQPNPQGPKKTNPATIVAIIAGIIILVAAAIIAVVLLMPHAGDSTSSSAASKNETTTSSSTASGTTASSTATTASSASTSTTGSTTSSSSTTTTTTSSNAASKSASSTSTTGDSMQDRISSPSGYVLPDSEHRVYSDSELAKLDNYTLFLARNEIYARYGRKFVSEELQRYFGGKTWYHGSIEPGDFNDNWLNETERANTQAMLAIEKSRNSPYV